MDWNFGDLLDATARAVPPDRPALIKGDSATSWGDFDRRTNNLAQGMLDSGLVPGDRVAILARNIPEYIEIAAAAFKARLTYVNLNYRYTTAEIDYVLSDCKAAGLFFQAEFAGVVAPLFGTRDHLHFLSIIGEGDAGAAIPFEDLTESGTGAPLSIERSPDDGYLLYTGGTTGRPKGVMWRAADARSVQLEAPTIRTVPRNMSDHVAMVRDNPAPGRVIPACPLMHGAGLNSATAELVAGGTVILLPSVRFEAEELWEEASRHGATRILIVGDVFARPMAKALADHPGRWALDGLRVISSAGLMWSQEVKSALVDALPNVTLVDILGASEASGFGYAITNRDRATPTGYFEPGRNTVIIDVETDRVLADDEAGEGWLARRPPFAKGYYGDPDKTAATYRNIGGTTYAIPGDMAARDAEGRLKLIGRGNMCINSGGEKIFPEEVEEALKRQPGVEDALVLGVPDPAWGKVVTAIVSYSTPIDEAVLRDALQADLAAYKLPRYIMAVDTMPRHASGKGDYRAAQAMMEAFLGR